MTPEFSRLFRLDAIGDVGRSVSIEADEAERRALAERFGLVEIGRLAASAELRREGEIVLAAGRLEADVVQTCVASGDPVPAQVAEPFAVRFVPARAASEEEVELAEGELDDIDYDGASIDLGEAVAQTLALALDPFPRVPSADERLRAAGVLGEGETGPFAALKALKDRP